MNQLKKYSILLMFMLFVAALHIPLQAFNVNAVSANGGDVSTPEEFVYALGGDEAAYNDGNTIILKSDIYINQPITIKSGEYVIQGSGCYIYGGEDFPLISLDGDDVTLTLGNDRGSDNHPSLTFNSLESNQNAVKINNGTLNIYIGTLFHDFKLSPIHLTDGTINMYGGVIRDCQSNNGGAFYIENGDLNITQGTFSNCKADNGGVIYNENGNIIMIAPQINNNSVSINGGVVYLEHGQLLINNGLFDSNSATDGGVIYNKSGEVNLAGGSFVYNIASDNGGALYNDTDGEMVIINLNTTTITFNEAANAAAIYNNGYIELDDAQITYNIAEISTGGIYNNGHFVMRGGSVSMNESDGICGGVMNTGRFEMYNGSISSNKSAEMTAMGMYNRDELLLGEHCFISFNNDVLMDVGATVEVLSELTANTPVATLTLPELKKGISVVTGTEESLISASEKIAVTGTERGTWYIDTEGILRYERETLSLPYQVIIIISAAAIIIIFVLISIQIKKRKGSN